MFKYIFIITLLLTGCQPSTHEVNQLDIDWIDQLVSCPMYDKSRYPIISPQAEELYNKAVKADSEMPKTIKQEKIVELYQQAAEQGHWAAMHDLAVSYYDGNGINKDATKAKYWLEEMAKFDIPEGYTAKSFIYSKGIGTPVDIPKSQAYLVQAAQKGEKEAQYYLAETVLNMRIIYPDRIHELGKKGIRLLECAANQGHKESHFSLALEYKIIGESQVAYQWLRRGAKIGNNYCLTSLAEGYWNEKSWKMLNLKEDEKRGDCLLKLNNLVSRKPDITFPDLDQRCPPNVLQPNVNDDPLIKK